MSPILVRPVREQLEHDRVIRLLQVRLKRRGEVAINIGEQQTIPVKIGPVQIYPDLVLTSPDKGKKLLGTVEVETAESVNHLEAMAQWAHLGRARVPFHLYVPAGSVEIARRLASENQVNVAEMWSYHTIGDQTRFTMVHRSNAATDSRKPAAEPRPASERPAAPQGPQGKSSKTAAAGSRKAKPAAPARSGAAKGPGAARPKAAAKKSAKTARPARRR